MNTFSQRKRHRRHINHTTSRNRSFNTHQRGHASETPTSPFVAVGLSVACALPVMVVLGFVFLLITSAVAVRHSDPHALILPLSLVAKGLTFLLGGLVVGRQGRGYPILGGLICGVMFHVLLWCLSCFFGQTTLYMAPVWRWCIRGLLVLLTMLGAKIGAMRR